MWIMLAIIVNYKYRSMEYCIISQTIRFQMGKLWFMDTIEYKYLITYLLYLVNFEKNQVGFSAKRFGVVAENYQGNKHHKVMIIE